MSKRRTPDEDIPCMERGFYKDREPDFIREFIPEYPAGLHPAEERSFEEITEITHLLMKLEDYRLEGEVLPPDFTISFSRVEKTSKPKQPPEDS